MGGNGLIRQILIQMEFLIQDFGDLRAVDIRRMQILVLEKSIGRNGPQFQKLVFLIDQSSAEYPLGIASMLQC